MPAVGEAQRFTMQQLIGAKVMVPATLEGWEKYTPPTSAGFPAVIARGSGRGAKTATAPTKRLWLCFDEDGSEVTFELADVLNWLME